MFALRTAPHESTGFKPAELVYAGSLRSPLRIIREAWEDRADDPSVVEYVLDLLDRRHTTQELAGREMLRVQGNAKLYYDRTARARRFEVGDQVIAIRPSQKKKLQVQWEGPADIVSKVSDTNYIVTVPGKRRTHQVYHSNLLKPNRQRDAVVNMYLNMPEEMPLDFPELATATEAGVGKTIDNLVQQAELDFHQKTPLRELTYEYKDRFSNKPGLMTAVVHDIELISSEPVRSKAYRVSPRQREVMAAEITKMLELGVIEPERVIILHLIS